MQLHAFCKFSGRSLSLLLSKRPRIPQIKQIHAQIIAQSLATSRISLIDSLVHCYLHCKNLDAARKLFDNYPLPSPPTLLWNLVIRVYSKLQHSLVPITLFRQMLATGAVPDEYTFTFVITSCAHQKSVAYGQVVHGMAVKNGCLLSLYVGNSLVSMYGVFARVDDACEVFEKMSERDVFSWTSLVCAYAKNGNMQRACESFWVMPVRNDVSWAAMVSGFVSCGMYAEALRYFHEMFSEAQPNEAVIVCAISACAHLESLDQGSWIHDYINKNRISKTSNITTALIDMYAKCGSIDSARQVFATICRPDVQNFTSIISGLSLHGLGEDAIRVFHRMLAEKLNPNDITILGVLNGCSHSGLVQHGTSIFYNMYNLWAIVPKIEHYGCYIDLLGRAGYLSKAFGIVKTMPMNPDIVIWRALLSACRVHRNAGFGERIVNHLDQIDPRSCPGVDLLLSNLYASMGKWERVAQVRKIMHKGKSDVGCSWIEDF